MLDLEGDRLLGVAPGGTLEFMGLFLDTTEKDLLTSAHGISTMSVRVSPPAKVSPSSQYTALNFISALAT